MVLSAGDQCCRCHAQGRSSCSRQATRLLRAQPRWCNVSKRHTGGRGLPRPRIVGQEQRVLSHQRLGGFDLVGPKCRFVLPGRLALQPGAVDQRQEQLPRPARRPGIRREFRQRTRCARRPPDLGTSPPIAGPAPCGRRGFGRHPRLLQRRRHTLGLGRKQVPRGQFKGQPVAKHDPRRFDRQGRRQGDLISNRTGVERNRGELDAAQRVHARRTQWGDLLPGGQACRGHVSPSALRRPSGCGLLRGRT